MILSPNLASYSRMKIIQSQFWPFVVDYRYGLIDGCYISIIYFLKITVYLTGRALYIRYIFPLEAFLPGVGGGVRRHVSPPLPTKQVCRDFGPLNVFNVPQSPLLNTPVFYCAGGRTWHVTLQPIGLLTYLNEQPGIAFSVFSSLILETSRVFGNWHEYI